MIPIPSNPSRKISISMLVFGACIIGIGLGLFGLNFWQATRCGVGTVHSHEEIEGFIDALTKRLLNSESQAIKNELLVTKVISAMQLHLKKLEEQQYTEILQQSKDEAIKVALYLAEHPAPPMPDFPLEKTYNDNEKLADLIDDIFGKENGEEDIDFLSSYEKKDKKKESITDADAEKVCNEWKIKYKVAIGISWGELPYDLQQKWLEYSCDYHMSDSTDSKVSEGTSPPSSSSISKDQLDDDVEREMKK
mmetsp:Transcript_12332/g.16946  ORF Transcript_12332/g.16946 Transcript_12332/m.16946 type:complete len:250 (-) Transcript_12332:42-791(-)